RIPRILSPVFDLFGNVGAAAGMLVLGIGVIVWGFRVWQSVNGKKSLYGVLAIIALAAGIFLSNYQFQSSEKMMRDIDESRQNQIDEVKKTARPDLKSEKANAFFDEFDTLYAELETKAKPENVLQYYDKFEQWSAKTAAVMEGLNNDQKYEFSQYYAKLSVQWSEKIAAIRGEN
ncbi:MAG: hypothetical protein LBD59_07400, partial [Prevotellaceae bacterium]|nr:hypothetical protein [Prevotellaceae bacterium]